MNNDRINNAQRKALVGVVSETMERKIEEAKDGSKGFLALSPRRKIKRILEVKMQLSEEKTKMQCQCGSLNIVSILAKCNDMFSCSTQDGKEHDGYVSNDIINIGSGDYIDFSVCLDCNKIQHDVRPKPEAGNDKR